EIAEVGSVLASQAFGSAAVPSPGRAAEDMAAVGRALASQAFAKASPGVAAASRVEDSKQAPEAPQQGDKAGCAGSPTPAATDDEIAEVGSVLASQAFGSAAVPSPGRAAE
ncbi:unnamed protein product, partial [Symbiodinium pilosum]